MMFKSVFVPDFMAQLRIIVSFFFWECGFEFVCDEGIVVLVLCVFFWLIYINFFQ